MIEIQGLNVSYGKLKALNNIDLSLEKGQCVALTGPNGSGKTTLIKCLLGMIFPDTGSIHFKGIPAGLEARKFIGYMPQISRFPEHMKVNQLFKLIRDLRPDQRNYDIELYENLEIEKFSGRPLGVLSEGMKQKVSAALAFLFNPEVLILDEPTSSLDPVANELLKQKISLSVSQHKLVLISSHILSDLDEITDRLTYLMNGELWIDNTLNELQELTSQQHLNKIIAQLLKEKKHAQDNPIDHTRLSQ